MCYLKFDDHSGLPQVWMSACELNVHPCAKVMALFFKCENFQTLTFSNFLKIWTFQIEVLVSIYVKFH